MKKSIVILCVLLCPSAMVIAQQQYIIQSDGGHVTVTVNEYGHGKPVVLLAGGPGFNAAYLEPIWKALPGYRFIIPDQRGTGHSSISKIDSATMTVEKYIEDLE